MEEERAIKSKLKMGIKEFIYHKNYSKLDKNEKIKLLERTNLITLICFFVMAFIFLVSFLFINQFEMRFIDNNYKSKNNSLNIFFDNLTKEEQKILISLIPDIKESYLAGQRSITFTKNITKITGIKRDLYGANINFGEIYIEYTDSKCQLLNTISHELLHTYMFSNEMAHEIIYDVANYLTPFKNPPEECF